MQAASKQHIDKRNAGGESRNARGKTESAREWAEGGKGRRGLLPGQGDDRHCLGPPEHGGSWSKVGRLSGRPRRVPDRETTKPDTDAAVLGL